jgi:hypothetical protein
MSVGGAAPPATSVRPSGILPGIFVSSDIVIAGRVLPAKLA